MGPPALTPVRRRDLAVLAAGLAIASWLLVRAFYGQLPPLKWWLPLPLALLALAEAVGTRTLRSRLADLREARAAHVRSDAPAPQKLVRPVEPLLVARVAVLAQASAYVGAVFVGIWIGVLVHVGPAVHRLQAAGPDTITASLGIVASAALIAAGLWLESVCRVPPEDNEPTQGASA
jgi:hypothetical protein